MSIDGDVVRDASGERRDAAAATPSLEPGYPDGDLVGGVPAISR
jgi:hypothetical protein